MFPFVTHFAYKYALRFCIQRLMLYLADSFIIHSFLPLSTHKDSKKHLSVACKEVSNDMLLRKKCSPRGDSFLSEILKQNLY